MTTPPKKINLAQLCVFTIALFSLLRVEAQPTFKKVWETKLETDGTFLRTSLSDGSVSIATTKKDACAVNGSDGSLLWCGKFIDIAQTKDAESQKLMEDAGALFLINNQKGNDEMVCIDVKTGKKRWSNSKYDKLELGSIIYLQSLKSIIVISKSGLTLLDLETGAEKWTLTDWTGKIARYSFIPQTNQLLLFNYNINSLTALMKGAKNPLMLVDVNTGKVIWRTVFTEVVEVKKFANLTFSVGAWIAKGVEKGIGPDNVLVDYFIKNGKIFMIFNGLRVYDLATGSLMWEAHLDLSLNRGMMGSSQMYNAVADPFVTGEFVYITDFSSKSRNKSIKKYELETGKLLWEAPVDGRKSILPNLYLVNGTLIAQLGGYVNIQGEQKGANGANVAFSKWKWMGPFGLLAFDAETGKQLWQSEKFDDRISNLITSDNNVFVADGSNLFAYDAKTGNNVFTTPTKPAKTGDALFLMDGNDKVVALNEKGISAYSKDKGKLIYAQKTDDVNVDKSDYYGNKFFLSTEDAKLYVDLNTGEIKGKYEYIKHAKYSIKDNGNVFFLYEEGKIGKYAID